MQEITLKRFSEISAQINSTEDLHDLLILIMDTAKDLLYTEGASLLLYDQKTNELFFDIVRGPKGNLLANQRLTMGEGIAGIVARGRKPMIVDDAEKDGRVSKRFDQKINFITRNLMAVPLLTGDTLVGVLEVVNSKDNRNFSQLDLDHLTYLSNQAAIAIYNRNLYQTLKDRMDELTCIYEISQTISSDYDFSRNANNILKSICHTLQVGRLSLVISEEGSDHLRIVSSIGFDIQKDQVIENVKNGVAGFVYRSGEPLHIQNLASGSERNDFYSIGNYKSDSFIAIPIKHQGKVIGVLNVTEKKDDTIFDAFDFRVLNTIGKQIAEAFGKYKSHEEHLTMEQLKKDLETASLIQINSLPHLPTKYHSLEMAYHYASCEAVGGDFYDMIIHGENLISFIIGDVSGKGVGAALFMEHIKTLLQSYVPRFKNPRTSVSELNRKILNEKRIVMFATVLIVQLEMENHSFRFSSAGHNRQFILRTGTKKVEVISGKGAPCGAFAEDKYQEFVLPYEEGDYLFLYTDGFTEAMNNRNEVYGLERLEEVLRDLIGSGAELSPKKILDQVLASVNNFTKRTPLHDDQTALVIKL